jgi:hypothetical protein
VRPRQPRDAGGRGGTFQQSAACNSGLAAFLGLDWLWVGGRGLAAFLGLDLAVGLGGGGLGSTRGQRGAAGLRGGFMVGERERESPGPLGIPTPPLFCPSPPPPAPPIHPRCHRCPRASETPELPCAAGGVRTSSQVWWVIPSKYGNVSWRLNLGILTG